MATMVKLSDQARADADDLVREGRFDTVDAAVEAGLRFLRNPRIDGTVDPDEVAPHVRTAVEEGLADIDAGRVHDAQQVFAELRTRYSRQCG